MVEELARDKTAFEREYEGREITKKFTVACCILHGGGLCQLKEVARNGNEG